MNQRCPGCGTLYRIDPGKVPPGGVRARCTRCPTVMEIRVDSESSPAGAGAGLAPEAAPASISPGDSVPTDRAGGAGPPAGAPGGIHPAESPAYERGVADPLSASKPDLGPAPFGSTDPHERARRLARALVSDIVAYHGTKRDRSLRDGTLRQELGPEIRKSWDVYSAQVGNQMARETSYFRDALNEILARGTRLF